MKRSSLLVGMELLLLTGCTAGAMRLPLAPFAHWDVLWFVLGLTVMKLSDVWLPRGDAVGMSSALALGALLLFDARIVLAMLFVAELLALLPRGRGQMWRPALTALTAEAAAAVVCSGMLASLGLHPSSGLLLHSGAYLRPQQYIFVLAVGLTFAALEFVLVQLVATVGSGLPIAASMLGSFSYGSSLIAAQVSAGVLAALMYRTMDAWGLLVSLVMILVMRQSFVLLLDIRQAYNSTVGVLIRAMEAQSPGREGLAERNADLSTRVGRLIGLHGAELERLRYAALLVGVGSSEEGSASGPLADPASSRIVSDVEFLSDVLPVLRLCESPRAAAQSTRTDLVCAYVVVAVGAETGTVNAEKAEDMRERLSPRLVREVDAALSAALAAS